MPFTAFLSLCLYTAWTIISRFILSGGVDSLGLNSGANIISEYSRTSMSRNFELSVPMCLFDEGVAEVCLRVKQLLRPEQAQSFIAAFEAFNC